MGSMDARSVLKWQRIGIAFAVTFRSLNALLAFEVAQPVLPVERPVGLFRN